MTQDDIIRMAREAGFTDYYPERLTLFAALVAAHEREKCAKVCEENRWGNLGAGCAAAIRARGEK